MLIGLPSTLAANRDGAVVVTCINPCIGTSGRGFSVPLPSSVRQEVDDIGVYAIICGSSSDHIVSLFSHIWSSAADWAWVEPAQR